jgi:hypothetical protein
MIQVVFLALSLLLLSACGSKLDDTTYESSNPVLGKTVFKFESGGKVYMSVMGVETELKYEVDGNKVKLISPQGNQILTLREDGSLEGLPTGPLRKTSHIAKKVEGAYSAVVEGKQLSLTFESGGKFHGSGPRGKVEGRYEIDGEKVKITNSQGQDLLLTWREDGSLEGSDGIRLTKK